MKLPKEIRPATATIRSRIVLEVAAELVARSEQPFTQAKVALREPYGSGEWRLGLLGSASIDGIEAVVSGEAHLAITNPAASLSLAFRGQGMFRTPQPVRAIAVIPSYDVCMLAVRSSFGISAIEEIAERRLPLKLSLRGTRQHWLHPMFDDMLAVCGCSLRDIESWGGSLRYEGGLPYPDGPRFAALKRGEVDAIFDESVSNWANESPEHGLTILTLREESLARLEAMGYRRGLLERADYPNLPQDVPTLEFSGWPIFVHAEASDTLVTQICEALVARKHLLPWQSPGPMPIERMAKDAPDTPQLTPLHPAAERYWRSQGWL